MISMRKQVSNFVHEAYQGYDFSREIAKALRQRVAVGTQRRTKQRVSATGNNSGYIVNELASYWNTVAAQGLNNQCVRATWNNSGYILIYTHRLATENTS